MKNVLLGQGVAWNDCAETQIAGRQIDWLRAGDVLFLARGTRNYATLIDETLGNRNVVAAPYFFVIRLSKLLRQAIEEAEKLFEHPLKQYMLFREFEEQVQSRRLADIPGSFGGNRHAQGYFGVFKKILPEAFAFSDAQI